jgi:integrase
MSAGRLNLPPKPKRKTQKLKGVKRVKMKLADGSRVEYFYHRATGTKLDPKDLAGSHAAAEKKITQKIMERGGPTLVSLIRGFDSSSYFDELSEASRTEYKWKLRRVEKRWGSVPVEVFNDPDASLSFRRAALAWHQELGKKSLRSADNMMACLARVLSFAKEQCVTKYNPVDTFKRLYKSDRSTKVWTEELQQEFIATARPAMVTAMYLVRNTGMRAIDIRGFTWDRYDGQNVKIRSHKTKGKLVLVPIPATRELKEYLDGLERTGEYVMVTSEGKPFSKRYFNECWREDANKVGAADLNFHDNRGTAATLLAEAGATVPQIAEAMFWSEETAARMMKTYIARRGTLAAQAYEKLEGGTATGRTGPLGWKNWQMKWKMKTRYLGPVL